MITFAINWLAVACGLVSKSVETASNLPMPLILLPFLGSTTAIPEAEERRNEALDRTPVKGFNHTAG